MCQPDDLSPRSFESLMTDPLIRLVMASDGVSVDEMREVVEQARAAICAREDIPRPRLTLVG
jgi:hypothetical protein